MDGNSNTILYIGEGIKTIFFALVANILGIYAGAFIIAFIASIVRMFYGVPELKQTTKTRHYSYIFLRYFFMALGITMLLVHIGLINNWSVDKTIIISGAAAFLSFEIITLFSSLFLTAAKKWAKIITEVSNNEK
jgi:hypothetical protein